jgi:phosphoribosylformimino-5-aminoimidazole carboxamide ribotide isomerase
MRLIPAIDIRDRLVAKSYGLQYLPYKSILCPLPDPIKLAEIYKERFGAKEIYIADLDAIEQGRQPNYDIYSSIRKANLNLRIDAGISDLERAQKVLDSGATKLIIGTETLNDINFVKVAASVFGSQRIMVSLDLLGEKVKGRISEIAGANPVSLASTFEKLGASEILILNLERASTGWGVNWRLVKDIVATVSIPVMVGSGIGGVEEIKLLREIGVACITLSYTLHEGLIKPEDITALKLEP